MADTSPQEQLSQEMARLTKAVQKSNSFGRTFFLGVVRGLGATIGAMLVAAVLVGLAWRAASTIKLDQYLGPLGALKPSGPSTPGAPQTTGGIFEIIKQLQGLQSGQGFDPSALETLLAPQTQPSPRRK